MLCVPVTQWRDKSSSIELLIAAADTTPIHSLLLCWVVHNNMAQFRWTIASQIVVRANEAKEKRGKKNKKVTANRLSRIKRTNPAWDENKWLSKDFCACLISVGWSPCLDELLINTSAFLRAAVNIYRNTLRTPFDRISTVCLFLCACPFLYTCA